MNSSRHPLGKVRSINKVEIKLSTVEDTLRAERKAARNEKLDNAVQWLGRGLRSIKNTVDVDSAQPTTNPDINRRAGRTAIAGLLLLGTAFTAGVSYLGSAEISKPDNCQNYELEDFGSDAQPGPTASMITDKIEARQSEVSSNTYDSLLYAFIDGKPVEVCGPAVESINAQIPERS